MLSFDALQPSVRCSCSIGLPCLRIARTCYLQSGSCPGAGTSNDQGDHEEYQSVRPGAPARAAAVTSEQADVAARAVIAPASPSRSQGAEVIAPAGQHDTAAGSGTDATATGYDERGQDTDVPSNTLPDKVPEVWKRQISQMIQDAVHQQPVDSRALLDCVAGHADALAKAIFESDYVQSSAPWKQIGSYNTPKTGTGSHTNGQQSLVANQSQRRSCLDSSNKSAIQAGDAELGGEDACHSQPYLSW